MGNSVPGKDKGCFRYRGLPAIEETDIINKTRTFKIRVFDQYVIGATGTGVSMSKLRAAVDSIDVTKLDGRLSSGDK